MAQDSYVVTFLCHDTFMPGSRSLELRPRSLGQGFDSVIANKLTQHTGFIAKLSSDESFD